MQERWRDSVGAEISPGAVIADKYRVERILGTGGMGAVLEAWHLQLDERVALKVLRPELVSIPQAKARFEREARAAFKIRSEHVVQVIDVSALPSGAPFMVLEYLDGHDLAAELEREGHLPVNVAVDYVLQAIEAIAEGHKLGIVHRDLKPENIFITRRSDGTAWIKVLDFGLSKLKTNESQSIDAAAGLTGDEASIGTPLYMSPEQWASSAHVGVGTDIWALGVMLFELVTGHVPFDGESMAAIYANVLSAQIPTFASLGISHPPALEAIVRRCLELDEEDRYANVAELAVALAEFGDTRARLSADRIAGTLGVELESLMRTVNRVTVEPVEVSAPTEREPRVLADTQADTLANTIAMAESAPVAVPTDAAAPAGNAAAHNPTNATAMAVTHDEPVEMPTERMKRVVAPAPVELAPPRSAPWGWIVGSVLMLGVVGAAGAFALSTNAETAGPEPAGSTPSPGIAVSSSEAPIPVPTSEPPTEPVSVPSTSASEPSSAPSVAPPPTPAGKKLPVLRVPPPSRPPPPPPPPPPIAPQPRPMDEKIKDALDSR